MGIAPCASNIFEPADVACEVDDRRVHAEAAQRAVHLDRAEREHGGGQQDETPVPPGQGDDDERNQAPADADGRR